ncbi:L-lactate permease [Marinomonas mediterranea]|nr:L-lactate permease [Marinomonas mediterranea]
MMDTLLCAAPILFLIWAMTKRNALPSHIALPLTAGIVGLIQVFAFHADITLLMANALAGTLSVLTPISIVAGAILLNRVLVVSGNEQVLRDWLSSISVNPVAQLMIIGWAFAFMLEGASGFGTPAAISAPILVGLGFPPLQVAMLALVMNSVPVTFGAVGTPIWFGFSGLSLSDSNLLDIAFNAAVVNSLAALIIPVIGLGFILDSHTIKANLLFILLSILVCTIPHTLFAIWNYEFPSLVGGAIGFAMSILLAKGNIGLSRPQQGQPSPTFKGNKSVVKALLPFLLLIIILVITRVPAFGIKQVLNDPTPLASIELNHSLLSVSHALILSATNLLNTGVSWQYKTLYVPAIIPFLLVALICIPLYRLSVRDVKHITIETGSRIFLPFISLIGALIMVKFMMMGEERAPMVLLANTFSNLLGEYWIYVASLLGALGSFFSGSATISNLTFGAIQQTIAQSSGLSITLTLALQSVGAAMGNMVCINNIIAVSTILNIRNQEGAIIKRTVVPMLAYAAVAALFSLAQ